MPDTEASEDSVGSGRRSKMVKGMERLCRRTARVWPEGPAPIMAILGDGDGIVVLWEGMLTEMGIVVEGTRVYVD
jgi:hypothetical protein